MTTPKRRKPPPRRKPFPLKKSKLISETYGKIEIFEGLNDKGETEIWTVIKTEKK